jgi:hypothetical protein
MNYPLFFAGRRPQKALEGREDISIFVGRLSPLEDSSILKKLE